MPLKMQSPAVAGRACRVPEAEAGMMTGVGQMGLGFLALADMTSLSNQAPSQNFISYSRVE